MGKTISIDLPDIGVVWADCGPWRCYALTATGTCFEELMEDATISEVDQDGGELNYYGMEEASNEVHDAALKIINNRLSKGVKHGAYLLGKN